MLLHKDGQINNVQLITGVRIVEMSQLKNCSVMCTKNGSYCENKKIKKVRGEGSRGMCTKNGSYSREKKKKLGGGGVGRGDGVGEGGGVARFGVGGGCGVWGM